MTFLNRDSILACEDSPVNAKLSLSQYEVKPHLFQDNQSKRTNFMAATATWCERNGSGSGVETGNVANVNWKAVDDPGDTTPYNNSSAVVAAGTNSMHKYHYVKFTGTYSSIGNVKFINQTGISATGITLRCQRTMAADSDRLNYAQPTRTADNVSTTPVNFSANGAQVVLYVGGASANGVDGAASSGKAASAAKPSTGFNSNELYTNYMVTQLQVASNASAGTFGPITLAVQFDET